MDAPLECADLALHRAKADGRGTWAFFEADMDARMQARRLLELDLRGALAAGQFEVFYQPLVESGGGGVSGFEALLRWRHPELGLVPPEPGVGSGMAAEAGVVSAVVRFGAVTEAEIQAYVATGEPLHCAGAFTVDGAGAALVDGVDGDPNAVIGLSVAWLRRATAALGQDFTRLWEPSNAQR